MAVHDRAITCMLFYVFNLHGLQTNLENKNLTP